MDLVVVLVDRRPQVIDSDMSEHVDDADGTEVAARLFALPIADVMPEHFRFFHRLDVLLELKSRNQNFRFCNLQKFPWLEG